MEDYRTRWNPAEYPMDRQTPLVCVTCGAKELAVALPALCATCLKRASALETLKRLPVLDSPEVHEAMEITEETFGSGASSSCSQDT